MTLRDVATKADVSIAYLSDLERAWLTNPTLDKLRAIATAVEMPIDALLGTEENNAARSTPSLPALEELAELPVFEEGIAAMAARWRRAPDELRAEWLTLLQQIHIAGRRPAAANDYLFIFESIRRALENDR